MGHGPLVIPGALDVSYVYHMKCIPRRHYWKVYNDTDHILVGSDCSLVVRPTYSRRDWSDKLGATKFNSD